MRLPDDSFKVDSFFAAALGGILSTSVRCVSFDFFDTVVKRSALVPDNFFYSLGDVARDKGIIRRDISNSRFRAERIAAEERARENQRKRNGGVEVSLPQIWDELRAILRPGIAPYAAAEFEFEAELADFFVNPVILSLIDLATELKKKIVFVSDTYFSSAQLGHIMASKLSHWDARKYNIQIYTSSDRGTGKGGDLFDVVLSEMKLNPGEMLHVGDNYHADVEAPARRGIVTAFAPNGSGEGWQILDAESRYASLHRFPTVNFDDSRLKGRLCSIRNLMRTVETQSVGFSHFLYGAFVFGPIFYGYLRWVREAIEQDESNVTVCGLLREGGFLADLLSYLYPELTVRKLGLSRVAIARAALENADREALLAAIPTRHSISLGAFAERIGLSAEDFPSSYARTNLSASDAQLTGEIVNYVLQSKELMRRVEAFGAAYAKRMRSHIDRAVGNDRGKLVLVDLGWAASIQKQLVNRLGFENDDVRGLYMALNQLGYERARDGLDISGFVFEGDPSHPLLGNALRSVEILEQISTPSHGSVVDYTEAGEPIFSPDRTPENQLRERTFVQAGIKSFLTIARDSQALDGFSFPAWRKNIQHIFLRAVLMPTAFEKDLFKGWVHDDSFAGGCTESLWGKSFDVVAKYLSPAQMSNFSFDTCYWPMATHDSEGTFIASQAAVGQLLSGDYTPFSTPTGIEMTVLHSYRGKKSTLSVVEPSLNHFGRSLVEARFNSNETDGLEFVLKSSSEAMFLNIDHIIFEKIGLGNEVSGEPLILTGEKASSLLGISGNGEAPGHAFRAASGTKLTLRIPEELADWRGGALVYLAMSKVNAPAPALASSRNEIDFHAHFDTLFGFDGETGAGQSAAIVFNEYFYSEGWVIETDNMRGPDRVAVVLHDGEREFDFPSELLPRPDLLTHFGTIIHGFAGFRCKTRLDQLPIGSYELKLRAWFDKQEVTHDTGVLLDMAIAEDQTASLIWRP